MSIDSKNYHMPFPTRLRALLEEWEVNQQEVADFVGVKRQTIAQWKDGKTAPDIYYFKRLAEFFNLPYEYLMGDTDSKVKENLTVADDLGLNDQAIEMLRHLKEDEANWAEEPPLSKVLSETLMQPHFLMAVRQLQEHIMRANRLQGMSYDDTKLTPQRYKQMNELRDAGMVVLKARDAQDYHVTKALFEFQLAINSILRGHGLPATGDLYDFMMTFRLEHILRNEKEEPNGDSD